MCRCGPGDETGGMCVYEGVMGGVKKVKRNTVQTVGEACLPVPR